MRKLYFLDAPSILFIISLLKNLIIPDTYTTVALFPLAALVAVCEWTRSKQAKLLNEQVKEIEEFKITIEKTMDKRFLNIENKVEDTKTKLTGLQMGRSLTKRI